MNYFLFNKQSDFERGYMENICHDRESFWVAKPETKKTGVLISRLLNSREKGCIWHRMVMESKSMADTSVQFSFYASDDPKPYTSFCSPNLLIEEKKRLLLPYLVKKELNPKDILLHDAKGQYLWFLAELYGRGTESPVVGKMQIFFPRESWIRYLPGVYQNQLENGDFLERFLGIFQSIYEDLERNIRSAPRYLDVNGADRPFLDWLASWIDINNPYVWPEDKLRDYLKQAMNLFKKRGTRQGLIDMVELYTGESVYVLEYQQVEHCHMERLYGENENVVFLFVPERCITSKKEYLALSGIVEDCKPAHVEVKIISLKPCLFLNHYSYLGINSVLGSYRPLSLDGLSLLPFTALGKTNKPEGGSDFEKS